MRTPLNPADRVLARTVLRLVPPALLAAIAMAQLVSVRAPAAWLIYGPLGAASAGVVLAVGLCLILMESSPLWAKRDPSSTDS